MFSRTISYIGEIYLFWAGGPAVHLWRYFFFIFSWNSWNYLPAIAIPLYFILFSISNLRLTHWHYPFDRFISRKFNKQINSYYVFLSKPIHDLIWICSTRVSGKHLKCIVMTISLDSIKYRTQNDIQKKALEQQNLCLIQGIKNSFFKTKWKRNHHFGAVYLAYYVFCSLLKCHVGL